MSSEKLELLETKKAEIKAERSHLCAKIWTEGKTDIKHLEAALRNMHNLGLFKDLQLDFAAEVDDTEYGSTNLLRRCEFFADTEHIKPMIAIFDRDEHHILQKAHDEAKGFKNWGNGVYSFAIPVPSHRGDYKEICIEHYYKDEYIKRENSDGRRLFFYEEFDVKTLRHRTNSSISISAKHNHKLKILDSDVFVADKDGKVTNIALSKNSFAFWVLEGEEIENLEFNEFAEIFKIIEKILQLHSLTFSKKG